MILLKYLSREVFHMMLAIMLVLLVIMVSVMFVRYLSVAAGGAMPFSMILSLIGVVLPSYIGILLPISWFLSIVVVYGRMFADSELLVMMACGMSWWQLTKITMKPALLLFGIVSLLSLYVIPEMSYHQDSLIAISSQKASNNINLVETGRFIALQGGQEIVYIGDTDAKTSLSKNLFIYRSMPSGAVQIILAPYGYMQTDPNTQNQYLVLKQGRQYYATPGQLNYQMVTFDSYTTRISQPSYNFVRTDLSAFTTWQLFHAHTPAAQAELQWRFTLPLTVLVVSLLGISICYVRPRAGRYSKLFYAIALFIIYFNLLSITRSLIASGKIPDWYGLWSVHFLFFVLAAAKIIQLEGGWRHLLRIKR
ncbi:MAG: lptF [Gammaproteobacteria bacterium]|nr:lptF [Gammaproteobacteria bacterium]